MNRFADRAVLITGAGRGIGRATAARFAGEGAALVILDRDGTAADAAAEALGATGAEVLAVTADITDRRALESAIDRALAAFGRIDVLVNNAYCALKGNLAETAPEDWLAEVAGTLNGAFLVTRLVLPGMVERGHGAIVNVGSVNGLLALGNPGYSAAKAGLLNFTKALATEYGPKGIRANMVSPGTIRTESPSWQTRLARDPQLFEKLARWYPVGRVGRPDDIAAAIAFLAADEAAFVNGANLVVDGGLTAGIAPMIQELTIETR
ncbi:MAG TPA: glucose 1-dehydrogenase [Geminicoccaceae bacterium]|nr:glucose 1-dehydrogenase [Geminicoccaceae bacterium]